jgi:hypothetical protein
MMIGESHQNRDLSEGRVLEGMWRTSLIDKLIGDINESSPKTLR